MVNDIFDFDNDKPGGVAGSIANGCAKLLIIGILGYLALLVVSTAMLGFMLNVFPKETLFPKRSSLDLQPIDSIRDQDQIDVRVTTEVNVDR